MQRYGNMNFAKNIRNVNNLIHSDYDKGKLLDFSMRITDSVAQKLWK